MDRPGSAGSRSLTGLDGACAISEADRAICGLGPCHTAPAIGSGYGIRAERHGGDLFVFRGRAGSLVKIIWHDGIGMSLYAKRLEKGRFVWPSAKDGMVSLTGSQLACLLEGIDWRNPQYSWRPASAG